MKITHAEFVKSSPSHSGGPAGGLPEFAFIGRSNVGKSSLINMLCNRKALARTSRTPGKTQTLNFFLINESWYLVDLPGYGYASVSRSTREEWGPMISEYILRRESLICIFVLIDSRLEAQAIDLDFIRWLGKKGAPFALVFTKCDKQSPGKTARNIQVFKDQLREEWESLPACFATSAETNAGRAELLNYIGSLIR